MTASDRPVSQVRWTICALAFFAVTFNYLDRQLFSVMVPFFEDDLKLGPTDLALINVSFILPYGLAMLFVGRFIDRIGTKKGLLSAYVVWSLASAAHALVRTLGGFMGIRLLLGVGESGMYPSAVKMVADWFPRRERATAIGIFNAGSNVGAILAPLLGVWIATSPALGWRACFLITGLLGGIWIFFWIPYYQQPESHPKVHPSELLHIRSEPDERAESFSMAQLFATRPVYGLAVAKALSDAPFWFYLTWMPKILVDQFKVSPGFMALAIPVIYIVADIGSIAGGWSSSRLVKLGYSTNLARKIPMIVCATLVVPVMSVGHLVGHGPILGIGSGYWAVGIVALAAGAHQGWSSNLFTVISDTIPQGAMAMAVGAINGFAMVGVSVMQFFTGWSVRSTSSYTLPFEVAGTLYLIAFVVLQVVIPQIEMRVQTKRANMPIVALGGVLLVMGLGLLQYQVNRPPYLNIAEYRLKRANELNAQPVPLQGPNVRVGWMSAQWIGWQTKAGILKLDLIKMDTYGHPFVESKGSKAAKYRGPTESVVRAQISGPIQ